jgi:hypothetical protein
MTARHVNSAPSGLNAPTRSRRWDRHENPS